jgi:methyltransferase (TIGR00027 family)
VARTDNDSWEITESVGATALGVASSRAAETRSENPLISDPFAQVFLDAVGDGVWNWHSGPELPAELIEAEPELPLQMQSMVSYMACRTAFFDQFFLDATRGGIRQVVILAAGLDSRSWRLPWPDGTTVYELDQPRVLEFKLATLAEHGAQPACNRVAVAVDLRQDWPAALQQAGFDPSASSAWSAEGLMPYLPAAARSESSTHTGRLQVFNPIQGSGLTLGRTWMTSRTSMGSRCDVHYFTADARPGRVFSSGVRRPASGVRRLDSSDAAHPRWCSARMRGIHSRTSRA